MVFELDLYAWPSFMFARHGNNYHSHWDGWLMPLCNFRTVSTAALHIDIGRAAIDRDASESNVTTAPLTVEADGEGSFCTDVEALLWINRWAMDRFEFDGSDGLDLADGFIADFVLFRLPLGESNACHPEVTLWA